MLNQVWLGVKQMISGKCIKCGRHISKNYNAQPSDKPSARILCDWCYSENTKPLREDKKECDHLYREFRIKNDNNIILTVYFYCQKCLDMQVRKIKL